MNAFNIKRAHSQKMLRGWDKLYWCIDLHDCIIEGKYNKFNEGAELYPGALEVLQWLSKQPHHVLILWSSSHPESITLITMWLSTQGIRFKYCNTNPECPSTELCDFSKKLYFNILLDDKAGFEGATDWFLVRDTLKELGEWI